MCIAHLDWGQWDWKLVVMIVSASISLVSAIVAIRAIRALHNVHEKNRHFQEALQRRQFDREDARLHIIIRREGTQGNTTAVGLFIAKYGMMPFTVNAVGIEYGGHVDYFNHPFLRNQLPIALNSGDVKPVHLTLPILTSMQAVNLFSIAKFRFVVTDCFGEQVRSGEFTL